MAPSCKIILDSPHGTYFAGQTVSGRVEVTLDKPKKIKGILLRIVGGAKVRWTERSRDRNVTYYSEEKYFETNHYCVGGENNAELILPIGIHIYNFACPLPLNLPSSFYGQYGNIFYTIEGVMERPWKWNIKTKIVFTVVSHYDINMFPNLCSSAKVHASKHFCCWCCRSGQLTATMQVPKTGFVSGERIPVLIEIDNASNVYVQKVKLHFQQFISFYAMRPSPKIQHDIVVFEELKLDSVEKGGSKTWTKMIQIPPLPPSSIHECSIIDTEYQIFIEVVVSGCHLSLKASIPITVGTIPSRSLPPQYDAIITSQPGTSQSNSNGMQDSPMPMQTFAENKLLIANSVQDDDDDHMTYNNDSGNFTPLYPTYDFKYQ